MKTIHTHWFPSLSILGEVILLGTQLYNAPRMLLLGTFESWLEACITTDTRNTLRSCIWRQHGTSRCAMGVHDFGTAFNSSFLNFFLACYIAGWLLYGFRVLGCVFAIWFTELQAWFWHVWIMQTLLLSFIC